MNDVMIDIETLGTVPGSAISSIGAIEFDAITGNVGKAFYARIDIADAQRAGMTVDAATVKWWMTQSKEAQNSSFGGDMSLVSSLIDLSHFIATAKPVRIWAHSPTFDIILLEAAYRMTGFPISWNYRQPRDTRTLFDLTGVSVDKTGVNHDALDDAIAQMKAVIKSYEVLGLNQPSEATE